MKIEKTNFLELERSQLEDVNAGGPVAVGVGITALIFLFGTLHGCTEADKEANGM